MAALPSFENARIQIGYRDQCKRLLNVGKIRNPHGYFFPLRKEIAENHVNVIDKG